LAIATCLCCLPVLRKFVPLDGTLQRLLGLAEELELPEA
jgi:hypothetical protein